MYTRFKSQKAGIKHGLNQIANSTRSRVVVPPTVTNEVKLKLDTDCSKVDQLSLSSSSTSSLSSSGMSTNSILATLNKTEQSDSNVSIFSNDCTSLLTINTTNQHVNKSSKNGKPAKRDESNQDEIADINCITYVKSLWEQYSSEIGTQNGPLRYVEDETQCSHLNGFVPLDMESWWAERSISCMINDKPLNFSNTATTTKISTILTSPLIDSKPNDEFNSLIDSNNNSVDRKFSLNTTNKPISYKLTYSTNKSIVPTLHNLNNFQLCFS